MSAADSASVSPSETRVRAGRLILSVWLIASVGALLGLVRYSHIEGSPEAAPVTWPASSPIDHASSGMTLVLLLHPRCQCSLATVNELARLLASIEVRPATVVLMTAPVNPDPAWEGGRLERAAARLPDVELIRDPGGRMAAMFGGTTSGCCLVYSEAGDLRFVGGITAGRGHEGANPALATLGAVLNGAGGEVRRSPTFGCPLVLPEDVPACPECGS